MNLRFTAILAAFGAALVFSGAAAAKEWTIDGSHTHVLFEIGHLGFSTSHGGFRKVSGTVFFDKENPEDTVVDVTIGAASVYTWQEKRDEHLRSADFFHVEKFPTLTFKSTKVELTSENTAKMTGDLTILGVTKPVILDVTLNKTGPHPFNDRTMVAGFSAKGALKRSDWGMKKYLPALGDDVKITIETELNRPR